MYMETEVLRWFQQVADGVTVTEVSAVYGVSQPAVSRALARLEAEVGTPLLRRSGRVLRLTHAGSAFKRHVDALVVDLDDGLAAVDQLIDPESGVVTVAFQLSLGTWLVPAIVAGFRRAHPGVRFVLRHADDAGTQSTSLASGRVDLEITARRLSGPMVRWRRLFSEDLYLAVNPSHALAARHGVGLSDVAGEGFVMLRRPWPLRQQCEDLCAAAGFEPAVAFEADDLPTVRGFVATGLGVAVVPAMGEDPGGGSGAPVRLIALHNEGATRDIGIGWPAERRLLPAAELFRRHVLREATRYTSRPARRAPGARPANR
jgi:DNA-binding transcriptional LysR family regulator